LFIKQKYLTQAIEVTIERGELRYVNEGSVRARHNVV